jgi:hypothetical protein
MPDSGPKYGTGRLVSLSNYSTPRTLQNDRFAGKLGEYSNVGSESGKGKTTHLGICDIRNFWLQVLGFPHARPRMYRFEVGVAACILIRLTHILR